MIPIQDASLRIDEIHPFVQLLEQLVKKVRALDEVVDGEKFSGSGYVRLSGVCHMFGTPVGACVLPFYFNCMLPQRSALK